MTQSAETRKKTSERKTDPSTELRQAEERAEHAEQQLEETAAKLASLEAQQTPQKAVRATSQDDPDGTNRDETIDRSSDSVERLRKDSMMSHLLDSLEAGRDIGHYGRLVFAMVAHHFLLQQDVIDWLTRDRDFSEEAAIVMLRQVEARDYNPPRRERILQWQAEQEFPILPDVNDPDCGNVYRNLKFPGEVYEHIQNYQEEKVEAEA